jgi:hypothetical protein
MVKSKVSDIQELYEQKDEKAEHFTGIVPVHIVLCVIHIKEHLT